MYSVCMYVCLYAGVYVYDPHTSHTHVPTYIHTYPGPEGSEEPFGVGLVGGGDDGSTVGRKKKDDADDDVTGTGGPKVLVRHVGKKVELGATQVCMYVCL